MGVVIPKSYSLEKRFICVRKIISGAVTGCVRGIFGKAVAKLAAARLTSSGPARPRLRTPPRPRDDFPQVLLPLHLQQQNKKATNPETAAGRPRARATSEA